MLTDEQRHIWNEQMALRAYDVHVMQGTVQGPRKSDELFLAVAKHLTEVEAQLEQCREEATAAREEGAADVADLQEQYLREAREAHQKLADTERVLMDVMAQACMHVNGDFIGHDFISAYERACEMLVERGLATTKDDVYYTLVWPEGWE